MNLIMVIIHLVAVLFVSAYLLILTIPLHLILVYIKKDKPVDRNDFPGPRSMENLAYHDYLVRAYKITKNDVLGTYSVGPKVFADLPAALAEAARQDMAD